MCNCAGCDLKYFDDGANRFRRDKDRVEQDDGIKLSTHTRLSNRHNQRRTPLRLAHPSTSQTSLPQVRQTTIGPTVQSLPSSSLRSPLFSRSIYVFAKTPQIKKRDGLPLLRGDIQFALLSYIFHDQREVFTSSYSANAPKMTFAELYIESMSRSSKCSRVVREKLMMDLDLAISVAMVSLLVNVGKMNTTLTCTSLPSSPSAHVNPC
jgi:hypothetical protein